MSTANTSKAAAVRAVPQAAWLAADQAFDSAPSPTGDELYQALVAADPHIRIDELDHLVQQAAARAALVPLWRPLRRYRERELVRLLTERCGQLRPLP